MSVPPHASKPHFAHLGLATTGPGLRSPHPHLHPACHSGAVCSWVSELTKPGMAVNLSCGVAVRLTGLRLRDVPITAPATRKTPSVVGGTATAGPCSSSCLVSLPRLWVWPRDLLWAMERGASHCRPVWSLGLKRPCKFPGRVSPGSLLPPQPAPSSHAPWGRLTWPSLHRPTNAVTVSDHRSKLMTCSMLCSQGLVVIDNLPW